MRIVELWRHPVKSMQGEAVASSLVTAGGVVGDRAWAIRDTVTGAVLSAKREPRLLLAGAAAYGEGVEVRLPEQDPKTGAAADLALSDWLGRDVRLDQATASPYVDEADLHLVTQAEIGEWDVRRFRPNVVVDGVASLDELLGERLALGSVVVELVKRTKRCAMTTMCQPGLPKDVGVLRELAHGRHLRLGVYARVVTPGRLDRDAPVRVI